jgi:hypothetical protein
MLGPVACGSATEMNATRDIDRLTSRQREILELVAKGLTNDDIAGLLGARCRQSHRGGGMLHRRVLPDRQNRAVMERPAIAVLPLVALDDDARTRTVAGAIARDLTSLFAKSCWFSGDSAGCQKGQWGWHCKTTQDCEAGLTCTAEAFGNFCR